MIVALNIIGGISVVALLIILSIVIVCAHFDRVEKLHKAAQNELEKK